MSKYLPLLILTGILASCIPNHKVVYLQDKGLDAIAYDELIDISYPDYQLQQGDIINIDVKSSNPTIGEIFRPAQVTNNVGNLASSAADINYMSGFPLNTFGKVELPLVGGVAVEGLTLSESKNKIETEIRKYITDAYVQVRLGGIRYSALGEFNRPGRYSILQSHVTIFEAIANAGDLTVLANREKAILIRQYPEGTKVHQIDLTDQALMSSEFYFIRPNDQLYLEPLPVRQFGSGVGVTGFQTFTSLLSVVSSVLLVIVSLNNLK